MFGIFKNLSRTAACTFAVNNPLSELIGDISKIHPDVRRFAISVIKENAADDAEFIKEMGRHYATVIASLYAGRDCNEIDELQWRKAAPQYKNFGELMISLGLRPRLIWPGYDRENAPQWATVE